MFKLPYELIDYIYSFDGSIKENFDKTMKELKNELKKNVKNCYPIKINNFENSPLFVNSLHYTTWLLDEEMNIEIYYVNNAKKIFYKNLTIHIEEYILINYNWVPNINDIIHC